MRGTGGREDLLTVEDLGVTVSLGPRRGSLQVLDGVDLSVGRGEVVAIVGESGSGKSTLARAILGLARTSAGRVRLAGRDLTGRGPGDRGEDVHRIQMVFQDPLSSFNPRFRVASALACALPRARPEARADRDAAVADALATVGLAPEHASRFPHELSGGQLQRAALARALLRAPDLIIADEPVSKLDVSVRAQILNGLKRLNHDLGVSLILITHDLDVARFLGHRIAVLYYGRIVECGAADALIEAPRHPYTARLVAARRAPVIAALGADAEPVQDPRALGPRGCHYRDSCSRRLPLCERVRPEGNPACFNPLPGPADAEGGDGLLPAGSRPDGAGEQDHAPV